MTDKEIGWTFLKHHVEVLMATFPDLKAEFDGKGEVCAGISPFQPNDSRPD